MSRYYIWTIGCQMNKADSERLAASLEQRGYQPAVKTADADLVVINSCVVRQSAENRVVGRLDTIKKLKRDRPNVIIALTGCLVDTQNEELRRRFPQVDFFFKPQAFDDLLQFVGLGKESHEGLPLSSEAQVCVYVPVIQGCNNFCSYCIVPYRRGREKSRPEAEVSSEVERLAAQGVREVTLLGQNVDAYGHDLPERADLADLLRELNAVPCLERIRFLTSHPKDMTPKLVEAVASLDKVCEHISLPLQAGDDEILQAMRRGYNMRQYCDLVAQIRSAIAGVALSTDVIVGFPGETEEQFQKTVGVLRELRFDTVHVAAYSPRPGTASAGMKESVSSSQKKRRLAEVEALQEGVATEINSALQGSVVEVLVEGQRDSKWFGRTRTNKLVFFKDAADCRGQMVRILVEKTSPWYLRGSLTRLGGGGSRR
ncbi:MAG: tRNA (N6-isopentenyl adenosine(37)-C2)-methylthiotransferase MiaB [Chloroflexota bacterium]